MKFRKKPVVIEAFQWQPDRPATDCPEWFIRAVDIWAAGVFKVADGSVGIRTLEGEMRAMPQDWIIQGVKGEIYPCKPDIFEATYEAV